MIRSRNPKIDIPALEARIAQELERDPQLAGDERLSRLAAAVHVRTVENALALAEQRSVPRTEWPAEMQTFPFRGNTGLQRLALRIVSLVFRDQHGVNAQLIRSQREMLGLLHSLVDRVENLESRLEAERSAARAERIARRRDAE
jgi:hypothetical protein